MRWIAPTSIDQLFLELLTLGQSLTEEEARHVRERLSEEELVVFDLLTRPGSELSTEERNEVKKVARKLLTKLRSIKTLDWQKTAQARARVLDAIEEALDEGLPRLPPRGLQGEVRGRLPARVRAVRAGRMRTTSPQNRFILLSNQVAAISSHRIAMSACQCCL